MHDSPRLRRLRNDLAALERLRSESSVFDFRAQGDPPHFYRIAFKGKGLRRDDGRVKPTQTHQVEIRLGSSYPRSMPEIRWVSPIYHPNISEIGMVCLGGYGTHWVPSVQLDELCTMLWDMARYHNFDVRSPYNRDAALWAGNQNSIPFPTDPRPIRDLREARGRIEADAADGPAPSRAAAPASLQPAAGASLVRRLFSLGGRSAEPSLPVSAPSPSAPPSPPPPLEEGVLILETHVDAAVAGEPAPAPAPRAEDDILFID